MASTALSVSAGLASSTSVTQSAQPIDQSFTTSSAGSIANSPGQGTTGAPTNLTNTTGVLGSPTTSASTPTATSSAPGSTSVPGNSVLQSTRTPSASTSDANLPNQTTSQQFQTSTTATPTHTNGGSNISEGALAGGIIAGLVVGALIAFLFACLLMRRRAKRQPRGDQPGEFLGSGSMRETRQPRVAAGALSPSPASRAAAGVDVHLPSPADDESIAAGLETLFENIGMHVDNYYVKQAIRLNQETATNLAAYDSARLPAPLAQLLGQARSGRPLITHVMTRVMLNAIDPAGDARSSVLPLELVGLPHAMENPDTKRPAKPATDEALSRWRVLTAYLLLPASLATTTAGATKIPALPEYTAQRDAAIGRHVTALIQTFAPWINRDRENEARINLAEIFKMAAAKGMLLFAQPCDFRFDWGRPAAREAGAIVVSPALLKATDEHGTRLRTPLPLVNEVVKSL